MKKILITLLFICIFTTGCSIRRDSMENINIYTTAYPIEYITKSI